MASHIYPSVSLLDFISFVQSWKTVSAVVSRFVVLLRFLHVVCSTMDLFYVSFWTGMYTPTLCMFILLDLPEIDLQVPHLW